MRMFRPGVFLLGMLASAQAAEPDVTDRITSALSALGYSDITISTLDDTFTVVAKRPAVQVPS